MAGRYRAAIWFCAPATEMFRARKKTTVKGRTPPGAESEKRNFLSGIPREEAISLLPLVGFYGGEDLFSALHGGEPIFGGYFRKFGGIDNSV